MSKYPFAVDLKCVICGHVFGHHNASTYRCPIPGTTGDNDVRDFNKNIAYTFMPEGQIRRSAP